MRWTKLVTRQLLMHVKYTLSYRIVCNVTAMADDHVEKIISEFLLDTCQQCQRPNFNVSSAACNCTVLANAHPSNGDAADFIPLTTGSVAEFYIQPMLSCVGDVDIMYHRNDQLAIPAGTHPPTQLSADYHSRVQVFDIIDSEFSGYVYLMTSYLLTECSDDGEYNAVQCKRRYVNLFKDDCDVTHGPALITTYSRPQEPPYLIRSTGTEFSLDLVPCVRCLSWPSRRHKPLIGQRDRETTAGQTQQLLIVLSATDVTWLVWHIVSVDNING